MMKYDLVIAGGGAAGLAAAASFIEEQKKKGTGESASVCILEKNDYPGCKINATGGGRCNLTNKACPGKEETLDFFRNIGIETWQDSEGRYYPYTNKASDVSKALIDAVSGADIKCGFTVKVISRIQPDDGSEGCFMITGMQESAMEMVFADKVLIAMGGKAGPQFGTTGDGYTIARTLGHTVTRVFPILTGIECRAEGVDFASLKGIRAKGTVILTKDGAPIVRDTGEIQFTEDSLSGICVFNLSSTLNKTKKPEIRLDLMPDYSFNDTLNILISNKEIFNDRAVEDLLTGIFNKKLGLVLLKASGIKPLSREISSLTQSELKRLTSVIKAFSFKPTMQNDFGNAQAASGGVIGTELDPQTMESLRIRGLYIIGECVDIDGDCGGFNLQFAFASGIIAGESV